MNTKHKTGWTGLKGMALAVLALLSLLPPSAAGQELIRECNVKGEPSLVRACSENVWMVYYEDGFGPSFAKVTSTGATADNIWLIGLIAHVTDFEIVNNILYFCGISANNTAVMGYFSLTNFPSTLVYTCTVPMISNCRKLEAGYFNGTRHVLMVGDALGTSHIIDARDMGSNQWNFNISTYSSEDDFYDDVAVTDNYVVISARDTAGKARLYRFNYPAANFPLLPQYNVSYMIPNHSCQGEVLLDRCVGDTVAYLTRTSSTGFAVGICSMPGNFLACHIRLASNTNPFELKDIKYNASVRHADAMMYDLANGSTSIFHITHPIILGGLTPWIISYSYTGHLFNNQKLMSLDALSNGRFIASGSGFNETGLLDIYRYKYDTWLLCFNSTLISMTAPKNPRNIYTRYSFLSSNHQATAQSVYCLANTIDVTTECQQ